MYPDLERTFYQVVDELNANPVTMAFDHFDNVMLVTGHTFMNAIYIIFYIVDEIANIPRYITEAGLGDYSGLEWVYPHLPQSDHIAWGVFYSLQCREEVPFEDHQESLALREDLPRQILDWLSWPPMEIMLCEKWDSGISDPKENDPVVSDVPTLVFAGRYDPITPPSWGRAAAEHLPNSYFYEFPANGHGVMRDNRCALDIGLQFINDPTAELDASCLANESPPDFK